ncbi:component of TRAPP complex, putative [Acanthamoeba castellanii str. Neff]|uniref:Trafficking protein particle complex subunit n=1 Tax=Acanthamoeba castellanii (strain ATCC 30010 / Neff) TaxID=1257118 RepID=L8HI86_ACACF|nr:component of TRAPP complex, putative [Acanthamoeba castellanii str. Neff]ELR24920.1 component of TRAPP complex, putative [Acanthamoeba castellanii str. Neff]
MNNVTQTATEFFTAAKKTPLNIIDRPLNKPKKDVSLSAYAYLFSELVQYAQTKVTNISKAEERLWEVGYQVGLRMLELQSFREKKVKRELEIVGILGFISVNVWKALFGERADSLERSTEHEDEYMIRISGDVLVNKYVSLRDGGLNTAAFVAGVVNGVLDAAEFPSKVSAHYVKPKTVILIKFEPEVIAREKRLKGA